MCGDSLRKLGQRYVEMLNLFYNWIIVLHVLYGWFFLLGGTK